MTIPFDPETAHRRRFDGGMGAHGDDSTIIADRRKWITDRDDRERARFCPRCTAYKGAAGDVCHACKTETDQGDT